MSEEALAKIGRAIDREVRRMASYRAASDRDDLYQHGWEEVLVSLPTYLPLYGDLTAWARQVARRGMATWLSRETACTSMSYNALKRGVAQEQRRVRVRIGSAVQEERRGTVELQDPRPTPEQALLLVELQAERAMLRRQRRRLLRRVLKRFRGPARAILEAVLDRYQQGQAVMDPGLLAVRLGLGTARDAHRAMRQFRNMLAEEPELLVLTRRLSRLPDPEDSDGRITEAEDDS